MSLIPRSMVNSCSEGHDIEESKKLTKDVGEGIDKSTESSYISYERVWGLGSSMRQIICGHICGKVGTVALVRTYAVSSTYMVWMEK